MKIYKLSAVLLSLLGGCTPEVTDWSPTETPKENKVDRAVFYYTVHYPAHANLMEAREKKNLHKFLKANILHPSAVTVILEEYGGHSEKRIKDIERELLKFGIPYDLITVEYDEEEHHHKHSKHHHKHSSHKHHGKRSGSGIDIIIERYVVIPPSCANFAQSIGGAQQAHVYSNYGCADTANLGMMIANPRDLIVGRPLGDSDGTVIAAGVDRYRKDNIKPLMETSTNISPGSTTNSTPTSSGASGSGSGGGGSGGGSY